MLHWLGGSARTWNEVTNDLTSLGARPTALDLPGFGLAAKDDDFPMRTAVEKVILAVQDLRAGEEQRPWLLVGHSMGGKIAACVARAAADGRSGLQNLAGMVLISPSPPTPEPMQQNKREELLQTLGKRIGSAQDLVAAEKFVDDNTGNLPLPVAIRARVVDDVLQSSPTAFAAWLTTGSKEDVSAHVATLSVPTVILAGTEDAALGPDAQRKYTLPHFVVATLDVLEGCGHLAPVERPMDVVERIAKLMNEYGTGLHSRSASLSQGFEALIASDLTSPQTRAVFESRVRNRQPDDEHVLSAHERSTLQALCTRVIPRCSFDLCACIESWLGFAEHDGWRDNRLPPDREAWRIGLRSLNAAARRAHSADFAACEGAQQDALLLQARERAWHAGLLGEATGERSPLPHFDAEQMHAWFEDVRGELTKIYVADPRTMEQIGFTGFADEGGFTQVRLGEFEEFER